MALTMLINQLSVYNHQKSIELQISQQDFLYSKYYFQISNLNYFLPPILENIINQTKNTFKWNHRLTLA